MKKSNLNRTNCKTVLALVALLAVPAWADEPARLPAGGGREEKSVTTKHASKQEVTFLGLVTRNADPALSAQFDLPPETGLVVVEVVSDGPAAGVLKVNDLLVRFDDQVLIEPRQLGVLVRSHKEGDEVKLTYYRGGKQQSANVKLIRHAVPEASLTLPRNKNKFFVHSGGASFGGSAIAFGEGRPGEMRIARIEHKNATLLFEDGKGRLEISTKDGKKFLTACNEKNEVIFSGPIETEEQRKAMPEEVRERLERMESTDVKIPVPPVLPLPPKAGAHSSSITIFGNSGTDEPVEWSPDDNAAS